ncbi:MAG: DMT family transporter [Anaerolineaceae bacterium]|jgi:drug/metabolite transporter (DMT)-like permease|nr:DMT family transporter [Anaerolineaceae bacterium]
MADTFKEKATALALMVTFLWATSWVLVKLGLGDLPPVTFAGLRYFLAFLILLPFAFSGQKRQEIKALTSFEWRNLVLLGLVYYTINQGAIFAALALLPAMAVSLILTFTSMVTAGIAIRTLGEKATWMQWVGILLNLTGAFLYFYPVDLLKHQWLGILLAFIGMLASSVSTVIGRKINRSGKISSVVITTISMGIGSIALLAAGLLTEKFPVFSAKDLLLLVVLAVVNTALAFTLWNKALQQLEAIEASVINNLVAFQIAVLAWVFLGERLSVPGIIGILLAVSGAILVQIRPNP